MVYVNTFPPAGWSVGMETSALEQSLSPTSRDSLTVNVCSWPGLAKTWKARMLQKLLCLQKEVGADQELCAGHRERLHGALPPGLVWKMQAWSLHTANPPRLHRWINRTSKPSLWKSYSRMTHDHHQKEIIQGEDKDSFSFSSCFRENESDSHWTLATTSAHHSWIFRDWQLLSTS